MTCRMWLHCMHSNSGAPSDPWLLRNVRSGNELPWAPGHTAARCQFRHVQNNLYSPSMAAGGRAWAHCMSATLPSQSTRCADSSGRAVAQSITVCMPTCRQAQVHMGISPQKSCESLCTEVGAQSALQAVQSLCGCIVADSSSSTQWRCPCACDAALRPLPNQAWLPCNHSTLYYPGQTRHQQRNHPMHPRPCQRLSP